MVRLSNALVQACPQVTTPLGERSLIVRGKNLQQLEASAAGTAEGADGTGVSASSSTSRRDLLHEIACSFDVLDLSDNALQRLDGIRFAAPNASALRGGASHGSMFEERLRLSTLILHNNRINRIAAGFAQSLASTLHTVVAHNNNFQEKHELNTFALLPNLERLSLMGNPVTAKPQYRLYTISVCCPKLKLLDYQRVRAAERNDAAVIPRESAPSSAGGASAAAVRRAAGTRRGTAAKSALAALDSEDDADEATAVAGGRRPRPAESSSDALPEAKRGPNAGLTPAEIEAKMADIEARLEKAETKEELEALEAEYTALGSQL